MTEVTGIDENDIVSPDSQPIAPIRDVDDSVLSLVHETMYKRLLREPGTQPPMLVIQLKEPFIRQGINQTELNGWIADIRNLSQEYGFSQYLPQIEDVTPSKGLLQFREEMIDGQEFGVEASGYWYSKNELNSLITKLLPMIEKHGFVFDIREGNILAQKDGQVKLVDLLPTISRTGDDMSLGMKRDPYQFFLEHAVGILNSSNMYKIANASDLPEDVKEYYMIKAHDVRMEEREYGDKIRQLTFDEAYAIVEDIAGVLQESPNVRLCGPFGSVARHANEIGDIDLFTVVDNDTFRKIVKHNQDAQQRRKSMRTIFYTPLKELARFFQIPQEKATKITEKRKITRNDIDSVIEMHLIALPEDISDPEIQEDIAWVLRHQPDAEFLVHAMTDAITLSPGSANDMLVSKPLLSKLGQDYWDTIRELTHHETIRRDGIRIKYDESPPLNPEEEV